MHSGVVASGFSLPPYFKAPAVELCGTERFQQVHKGEVKVS